MNGEPASTFFRLQKFFDNLMIKSAFLGKINLPKILSHISITFYLCFRILEWIFPLKKIPSLALPIGNCQRI